MIPFAAQICDPWPYYINCLFLFQCNTVFILEILLSSFCQVNQLFDLT
jgi:hypothetical protein